MKQKKIKVGFVGSGFAAKFHYNNLIRTRTADLEIIGVLSLNLPEAEQFVNKKNIKIYDTLASLIDDCDSIHACTPPSTHEEICVKVLEKNKSVIVEKPLTGYYGDGSESFSGQSFKREIGLEEAKKSIARIIEAEKKSKGKLYYAENWIYSPVVQKEKEIIQKTKAQVLWIKGEQSHSGSLSKDYGIWSKSGGGSLVGKGCHPLSTALYFKQVEGLIKFGKPIQPVSISCRVHAITKSSHFEDIGIIRKDYQDIEDVSVSHIVFEDDTIADIFSSDIVMGGIINQIEVVANNHRTICNMNPNNAMQTFNPINSSFKGIHTVEKIETKEGWTFVSPDESWFNGYENEMNDFYDSICNNKEPESGSSLAANTIMTIYAGYLSSERNGQEVLIPKL